MIEILNICEYILWQYVDAEKWFANTAVTQQAHLIKGSSSMCFDKNDTLDGSYY